MKDILYKILSVSIVIIIVSANFIGWALIAGGEEINTFRIVIVIIVVLTFISMVDLKERQQKEIIKLELQLMISKDIAKGWEVTENIKINITDED